MAPRPLPDLADTAGYLQFKRHQNFTPAGDCRGAIASERSMALGRCGPNGLWPPGLGIGVDFRRPALKLPGLGRVGA
jgi:hypothetical protein